MSKRRDRGAPKERLSPTHTVAHLTDDLVAQLNVPELPESIPERLQEAIRKRVNAFLFLLKEAQKERYVAALEIRLVRDAYRAVLTAYELGLPEGEVYYASFRRLVEELGYERTDVGFARRPPPAE